MLRKHPIVIFGQEMRQALYDLVYRQIDRMDKDDPYGPISVWDTYFRYAQLHNNLAAPFGMLDHYIEMPHGIYPTISYLFGSVA
jgi:hypothetical protein